MAKGIIPFNREKQAKDRVTKEYSFEETVAEFNKYDQDSENRHKIFAELGFSWHDDEPFCGNCDRNGSCPDHPGENGRYLNGRLNMDIESSFKKIKIYVDAPEIADAMEWQSDEIESFYHLDVETGEVIYFTADVPCRRVRGSGALERIAGMAIG